MLTLRYITKIPEVEPTIRELWYGETYRQKNEDVPVAEESDLGKDILTEMWKEFFSED